VEQAIAGWPLVQRARLGWTNLKALLESTPEEAEPTALPRPRALLEVNQITVFPPEQQKATLRMLDFRVEPGQALGVIGMSASGKSTLARVLTGIWRPAGGSVRLDGAALDHYAPDVLGSYIGYLPQDVVLFDGTVAENIGRLLPKPDPEQIVAAAKKAGAHEMVLALPQGYDTQVSAGGGRLSGGQKQRIGLARAFYGDPVMLVLDEPNSNLDAAGQDALNLAIRQAKAEGKIVIIMAHRPAGIAECDHILIIDGGVAKALGPRDEVLKAHVRNYAQVAQVAGRITPEGQA
jgi:ATP-binding cassette subfamily C protein